MIKNIKILLLEDNFTDADLILRQLTKSGLNFQSETVDNRQAFEDALQNFKPDLILSDYSLPSFDAVSAFRILQQHSPLIPFIIVSGIIGEENAVMLIKNGVTDYVAKNNLISLSQKIDRALKDAEETQERKDMVEKLKLQTAALLIANDELIYQNEEKERRAVELQNVNKELLAFNFISSHDLQEPLRKIQTFASMMMIKDADSLTEASKTYIERIQVSAERMQRLIKDLLAFSQVSSAERQFELTNLHTPLEEILDELKDTITEKHAMIIAVELLPVSIIPFQFRQLMCNLISNSLKFARPDVQLQITIETQMISSDDATAKRIHALSNKSDYWNFTFTDNGIGFEPQFNDRIFGMFQKLHNGHDYSGTGIGLAIVKKVVDNHNGIIVAKGQPNKGATFNIYIPVKLERQQVALDIASAI
ncbi:MAG TPA: ATP-binding protein [Flavobacterium sp.]|jgi:signal transduction histidine kinase